MKKGLLVLVLLAGLFFFVCSCFAHTFKKKMAQQTKNTQSLRVIDVQGDQVITDQVAWDENRTSYRIHGKVEVKEGGSLHLGVNAKNVHVEILGPLQIEKGGKVEIGHRAIGKPDTEVRVKGNVEIGGNLTISHAVLGISPDHPHQYYYKFKGGTLITKDHAAIGGVKTPDWTGAVYFDLSDGNWICDDTTIQWSVGLAVSEKGKLMANHIIPGEIPDGIGVGAGGHVEVKNSTFEFGIPDLNFTNGGSITLSLPANTPIPSWNSSSLDSTVLPPNSSLKLTNVTVSVWWLTLTIASKGDAPEAKLVLDNANNLGVHVSGNNLRNADADDFQLPVWWDNPPTPSFDGKQPWVGPIPAGRTWQTGNLKWEVGSTPAGITNWAFYSWGPETDLTLRGPTNISEVILWEGKVSIVGTPGHHDAFAGGTVFHIGSDELSAETPQAVLTIKNAAVGVFSDNGFSGAFLAKNNGSIQMENVKLGGATFWTLGNGKITGNHACKFPFTHVTEVLRYREVPAEASSIEVEGKEQRCR